MTFIPMGIPVDELDSDEVCCYSCGAQIADQALFVDELDCFSCELCIVEYVGDIENAAQWHARETCKITDTLPLFDAENQFRCSPEDYKLGIKSSNTPNSHLARCRHDYTNYDALIRPFQKSSRSVADRVFYSAIRERTDEMLIAEIERTQPDEAQEFNAYGFLPG